MLSCVKGCYPGCEKLLELVRLSKRERGKLFRADSSTVTVVFDVILDDRLSWECDFYPVECGFFSGESENRGL